MKELYKFFKENGRVVDIKTYDPALLGIFSRDVLHKINNNEEGWEEQVPEGIAELIKLRKLFGWASVEPASV